MSLFFFVSGFFTRMMWEKRGTQSLLRHRTKRIILPFLIFGALIFPILNNMGAFVSSAATSHITAKRIFINPKYKTPENYSEKM
jgi:fucose 4-O-acetylase-like acetyltransferase